MSYRNYPPTPKTYNSFDPHLFLEKTNEHSLTHSYALGAKFIILRKQLIYFFNDINRREGLNIEHGMDYFQQIVNRIFDVYEIGEDDELCIQVNNTIRIITGLRSLIQEQQEKQPARTQVRLHDDKMRETKVEIAPGFEVLLDFHTFEYCVNAVAQLLRLVYVDVTEFPARIADLANATLINQASADHADAQNGEDGASQPATPLRVPTVIVFDNSLSSGESHRTSFFDEGFHNFIEQLAQHPVLSQSAELQLTTCGGPAPRRIGGFAPIADIKDALLAFETKPFGSDCMGEAILQAIDDIMKHCDSLDADGVKHAVPRLIVISDGLIGSDVNEAATVMKRLIDGRQLQVEVIGLDVASTKQPALNELARTIRDGQRVSVLGHTANFFTNLLASMLSLSQRAAGTFCPTPNYNNWGRR